MERNLIEHAIVTYELPGNTGHPEEMACVWKEQRQFVILRRYRDLPEAVVVKSILDFAGIECFLTDENLIRMDWFWSGLIAGVRLWVGQQDVGNAQNLVDQRPPEGFNVEGSGSFSSLTAQTVSLSIFHLRN